MLTRINPAIPDWDGLKIPTGQATFPSPFPGGLEYSSPARGTWNIVHTGMLVPQAHEIFVCGASCLRGVVLTAAEMGAGHRFSTIEIREHNLYDGSLESLIVDGVTDILEQMETLPPAVLVYSNCIHHFAGCDLDMVYAQLRSKFPTVDFADCYMDPIMRKSGLTPDQMMRRQLYSLLRPKSLDPKMAAIIGSDLPTDKNSELYALCALAGVQLKQIHDYKTYQDYQQMAGSSLYLSYYPSGKIAGETLQHRLGGKALHLPVKLDFDSIHSSLTLLADALAVPMPDYTEKRAQCEAALAQTARLLGKTPVAIDYTAFPYPLNLARLLLEHGFHVKRVYADSFPAGEKEDFLWLQAHHPELELYPAVHPRMRFGAAPLNNTFLAIGQKAAHFTGTNHFVNIIQCGGLWGYSAITALCAMIQEAYLEEKDMRRLVTIKGWGCECCL